MKRTGKSVVFFCIDLSVTEKVEDIYISRLLILDKKAPWFSMFLCYNLSSLLVQNYDHTSAPADHPSWLEMRPTRHEVEGMGLIRKFTSEYLAIIYRHNQNVLNDSLMYLLSSLLLEMILL